MDNDRVLWAATQDDFTHALDIVLKAWNERKLAFDGHGIARATNNLMMHVETLRGQERIHARVPPAAVKGDVVASQGAGGDIPPCPTCGGETYDNREKKASGQFKPTSPDFTCKDKQCKNEKGFRSGVWVKQENTRGPRAQGNAQPVAAGGYDQKPGPLINDEEDTLPF